MICHVRQEYVPGWYGRYETKIRQHILSGTLGHVVLMQLAPFVAMSEHFASLEPFVRAGDRSIDVDAELDATAVGAFSVARPARSDGTAQAGVRARELRGMPVSDGDLENA